MTIGLQASAEIGDAGGVSRIFDSGDSPSPFPFYDFRAGQYKVECISGGPLQSLGVVGPTLRPTGAYCNSPFLNHSSVTFTQSHTGTPLWGENDETFGANGYNDSADYGTHGAGDWDSNNYKAECPANRVVVGIARTTDSSAKIDTIHCAGTAPMCFTGNFFYPTNTCPTYQFTVPNNSAGTSAQGCDWDELMVGVSVDTTYHHPHAVLCCRGAWAAC